MSALGLAITDAYARTIGEPLHAVLGEQVRSRVEFSGYLFFKWARHLDAPIDDEWGETLSPDAIVEQARRLNTQYGFDCFKLKARVLPVEIEIASIRALRATFPAASLRIDPNGKWTPATSLRVAEALRDDLDCLEDPTWGEEEMLGVTAASPVPTATNLLNEDYDEHQRLFDRRVVDIILLDHHVGGGPERTVDLAQKCRTAGRGVSMHSNSHLGISLRAMTQVAAVIPGDLYACDTHYPWNGAFDVTTAGTVAFDDAHLDVSDLPGLGCDIDQSRLAEAHERYLAWPGRERSDAAYMRRKDPSFDPTKAIW